MKNEVLPFVQVYCTNNAEFLPIEQIYHIYHICLSVLMQLIHNMSLASLVSGHIICFIGCYVFFCIFLKNNL